VRARRLVALLALTASAAAVGSAHGGFTPAWSYLSPALRARLAAQAGGTLFLPARTPLGYRYRSGAAVSHGILTVPFTRRVRLRQGVYRWTKDTFIWRTQRFSGACTSWAPVDKTLQLSGNKVYWSEGRGDAWRCVTDRLGRKLVVSASHATALGDAGLGVVVASGLDVSRKTSAVDVALAVTPASVRRGGTVVVHGVAGGCTSGDAVTILSRAFSTAHEFAGVPAVYAQVGSAGRFSVKTRIPATRAPGRYGITARCGGGNLGVRATLMVNR
jgi:hypothetical protein